MNYKHLLLPVIITLTTFAACKRAGNGFTINGKISDMPEQNVILEQVNANDIITIVDSQRSDKKGNFEITAVSTEPGLYRLHFNSNKYILLSLF